MRCIQDLDTNWILVAKTVTCCYTISSHTFYFLRPTFSHVAFITPKIEIKCSEFLINSFWVFGVRNMFAFLCLTFWVVIKHFTWSSFLHIFKSFCCVFDIKIKKIKHFADWTNKYYKSKQVKVFKTVIKFNLLTVTEFNYNWNKNYYILSGKRAISFSYKNILIFILRIRVHWKKNPSFYINSAGARAARTVPKIFERKWILKVL